MEQVVLLTLSIHSIIIKLAYSKDLLPYIRPHKFPLALLVIYLSYFMLNAMLL